MRRADVVHQHQIAGLPRLARGVGLVDLAEQIHDVLADGVVIAEAGVERQPVRAVDVEQELARLLRQRPFVEEGDLVEPAAPAGDRVPHHRASMLRGAQSAIGLPLACDRVGAAIALDSGTVLGAERLGEGRADLVIVAAGEQPALPLEPGDEPGWQRVEHGRRVGQRRRSATGGCHEGGAHAVGIGPPGCESLLLGHQAIRQDRMAGTPRQPAPQGASPRPAKDASPVSRRKVVSGSVATAIVLASVKPAAASGGEAIAEAGTAAV